VGTLWWVGGEYRSLAGWLDGVHRWLLAGWLLAAGCCCTPSTVHCAPSIVQDEHATTSPPLHPTHRLISVFLLHELKSVYVARKLIYSAFTSFPSATWHFERMCQVD